MFPKLGLLWEASVFLRLCVFLSTALTAVEVVSHKEPPPRCPFWVQQKRCWRVGQWGKSDFCPWATRANPSSSFPQIPQKEYLGTWDRSHWRALSSPLRASTTSREEAHCTSSLGFLTCVLRNLMLISSASIHIVWGDSYNKDPSPQWEQPRERCCWS